MAFVTVLITVLGLVCIVHLSQGWDIKCFCRTVARSECPIPRMLAMLNVLVDTRPELDLFVDELKTMLECLSPTKYIVLTPDNATKFCDNECVNLTLITIMYTYGFNNNINDDRSIKCIKTFTVTIREYNICVIDWPKESNVIEVLPALGYPVAVKNCLQVGREAAIMMLTILKSCSDIGKFHFVGFSLGGQMMGELCRTLKDKGVECDRITGCDAAGVGFGEPVGLTSLSRNDARFVDMIATSSYGLKTPNGHCNFYPNCDCANQPGCTYGLPLTPQGMCSHVRSVFLYLDTAEFPFSQPAVSAPDCKSWRKNTSSIDVKNPIYMGLYVNRTCSGNYFYITKDQSPYGMGFDGFNPSACT